LNASAAFVSDGRETERPLHLPRNFLEPFFEKGEGAGRKRLVIYTAPRDMHMCVAGSVVDMEADRAGLAPQPELILQTIRDLPPLIAT
jgi:hypothetical protein